MFLLDLEGYGVEDVEHVEDFHVDGVVVGEVFEGWVGAVTVEVVVVG